MSTADLDMFTISLEPQWHNLEHDPQKIKQFDGKWILVGSIVFKKKAKESVNLSRIHLQWKGEHIDHLLGSLYKKSLHKEFLPIEKYLVCDGSWNKTKQILILPFDKRHILGPLNIFYLVLTIPEELEETIKKGRFTLEENSLPEQFKICSHSQSLSLAFNTVPSHTTI